MRNRRVKRGASRRATAAAVALACAAACAAAGEMQIVRAIDIARVWSAHPVGFCLRTCGRRQYAAFYDDERRMTVAARTIGRDEWRLVRLPERLGWDSHNYVTLTADDEGHLHLSGNMHCHPLKYFRTTRPWDVASFQRIKTMVGPNERRCTYPRFFRGPSDELIFTYRDGGSGNGNQIYNTYEPATKAWRRLLDGPLTDGQGRRNAYLHGPVRGPDGWWHLCWVWRETPDCRTNHDPSYARSRDLVRWHTPAGKPVKLPMTLDTPGLIVDPVPVGGGVINGNVRLGFDARKRAIVSYHKFDERGKTQLYNARWEGGRWRIRRASDWDYRWDFHGGGAIPFGIRIGGVQVTPARTLVQSYRHPTAGSGSWLLDEATLKPTGPAPRGTGWPKKLARPESAFPGMQVRWARSSGRGGEAGVQYVLRWEALPPNRDRPRKPPLPAPTMLRLYELRTPAAP